MEAGANQAQVAALRALEKGFDTHFPVYAARPEGHVHVTYRSPDTGTVTALIELDGTTRVHG